MDIDASADDTDAMIGTTVTSYDPGDTLGKLLAFVNQVRMSSEGVREYLARACVLQSIKPIELRLWVRTRWGSLSHCLESMLEVQKVSLDLIIFLINYFTLVSQAIDYFCMTADANEDLPPLTKKKSWQDYHLSQSEWKLIKLMNHCLKVRLSL